MQQDTQHDAKQREQSHAKLLTFAGRQVLVFLQRDFDGNLQTIFQIWVADTDEQLRAAVTFEANEDQVQAAFDDITAESICAIITNLGLLEAISAND